MNTAWFEEQKPALNGCKNKKELEGGGGQHNHPLSDSNPTYVTVRYQNMPFLFWLK